MSPNVVVCISDASLRSLFSLLLTDLGAHVAACPDDDEVQRVLASRSCQLCVLSHGALQAPGRDTGGLISTVRRLSPDTRILLLAAREQVDDVLPLFSRGLNEALLQPINPRRALDALRRLLDQAAKIPVPDTASGSAIPWTAQECNYRPLHVIARSPQMRGVLAQLWKARQDPLGVILRAEPGTEFELLAREYQAMSGDPGGYPVILSHHDVTSEGLANACSLDRLNEGAPRTFFLPEVEKLPPVQQAQLIEYLRIARRRRDRDRPLRLVFGATECDENGQGVDCPFLEELLFVMPAVVRVPALRERREDIEPLVRKFLMDLTAIFPAYRVRSINPLALSWLNKQLWRGNYQELSGVVRKAIMDCTNRELNIIHLGKMTDPE
ncbi:MAG: hypothetical protein ABII82_05160, partial [Verrucomicrobiota bacterium]